MSERSSMPDLLKDLRFTAEAGAERLAKALVGGLVQLGLIARDATGAPQFDLDSATLPASLKNQLPDGASELILAEVLR
ncbi:MAG: hypothetical protein NTV70_15015 [Acidobacteria bacterium]|nr:hypothetical protein [Acidobacteriota bacterium]